MIKGTCSFVRAPKPVARIASSTAPDKMREHLGDHMTGTVTIKCQECSETTQLNARNFRTGKFYRTVSGEAVESYELLLHMLESFDQKVHNQIVAVQDV